MKSVDSNLISRMRGDQAVKRRHVGINVSNLLITAKRMFARLLREAVNETVGTGRDVDAEIRDLKRILSKS